MELWKNIEEATNYEVSNLGNIRNTKSGQILNPGVAGNGYKQVSLKIKNRQQKTDSAESVLFLCSLCCGLKFSACIFTF